MSTPDSGMASKTSTLLLEALKDRHNEDAWRELDGRYRPVILAVARKLGVSEADAADVAQETLVCVLKDYTSGKYDRARGRLRNWIISIARFRIADVHRAHAKAREARGESAIINLPGEDEWERLWDEEVAGAILKRSLEVLRTRTRMNPRTIQAFEMVALQGRPAAEVAAELKLTVNDVYVAKNRAIEKLQAIRKEFEEAYESQ